MLWTIKNVWNHQPVYNMHISTQTHSPVAPSCVREITVSVAPIPIEGGDSAPKYVGNSMMMRFQRSSFTKKYENSESETSNDQ
jgi:hypothetical protein